MQPSEVDRLTVYDREAYVKRLIKAKEDEAKSRQGLEALFAGG